MLWMLPPRNPYVVDRPALMGQLLDALIAEDGTGNGTTIALHGAGGFGKTVLAVEACRRQEVRSRYSGGLLWITIGETARGPELAVKIDDLCERISGRRPGLSDPEQAGFHLAQLIEEREPTLVVLDDVWTADQLLPFLTAGAACTRLVTTRNLRLLPPDAMVLNVDGMTADQARLLLSRGVDGLPQDLAGDLLGRVGRWPMLLSLANGATRRAVLRGAPPTVAAQRVLERLDTDGPHALDVRNAAGRHEAVRATIQASLDQIRPEDRPRYAELAVFAEDADIPLAALERLWRPAGMSRPQIEDFCAELADLSLIVGYQMVTESIRLHDVLRAYLRSVLGADRLAEINRRFLASAATLLDSSEAGITSACRPWWTLPTTSFYLWRHLAYHFRDAGLSGEHDGLVADLRWLDASLRHLGPVLAAADISFSATFVARALHARVTQSAHLLSPIAPEQSLTDVLLAQLSDIVALAPLCADLAARRRGPRLAVRWPLPDQPHPAQRRLLIGHRDAVWGCAIAPDGSWLASGSADTTVRIWNTTDGTTLAILTGHSGRVNCCAAAPDGSWLASASDDMTVRIWSVPTGEIRHVLRGHTDWVWGCAVSADGRLLISVGDDTTVRIWDPETGAELAVLRGHTGGVNGCAVAYDGRFAATVADDMTIRVWQLSEFTEAQVLQGHADWVKACSISRDSALMATAGGADLTVHVWDTATWRTTTIYRQHTAAVRTCAIAPDGRWAVSGGSDRFVRVWDTATGQTRAVLDGHTAPVRSCAIAPSGDWLISAGDDRTVRVWDAAAQQLESGRQPHTGPVWTCAVAPDGAWLVTGGEDGAVNARDTASSDRERVLTQHGGPVRGCAIASNGRWLASASDDATVRVCRPEDGGVLAELPHENWVKACAASLGSTVLVTAGGEPELRLWDVATGTVRGRLSGHREWVWDCCAGPGGSLVSAGDDGSVRLWDMRDAELVRVMEGHEGPVRCCAVSPDGSWIASAGDDGTIRVWDPRSGQQVQLYTAHEGPVWSCHAAPSSGLLASAGADGTVRVWRTDRANGLIAAMRVGGALYACRWLPDASGLLAVGECGVYLFDYKRARIAEPTG